MSDVFDEDLMRELGIQPEDMVGAAKAAGAPTSTPAPAPADQVATPASAAAQTSVNKTPPKSTPSKLVAQQKMESSFTTEISQVPPAKSQPAKAAVKATVHESPDFAEYGEKMTQNLPVQIAAVMAKKSLTLKEIMELRAGEVIDFKKSPQDLIDLVVNGKLVAKAELVMIDGKVGARVVKLVR